MTKSDKIAPTRTDTDDHLSVYFRHLGDHELLTSEDERELSKCLEDTEVLAWVRVLARPDVVLKVFALIESNSDKPLIFPKLYKALNEVLKPKPTKMAMRHYILAAKSASGVLRKLDYDRVHIDAVIRELSKNGASAYITGIRQVHREATNLREEFVRANLRLVVTMARRYDRGGMALADLIQEGNLGLMHAIPRFDYRRKLRFSTYACWWIRHAIGRALADKARTVRIPVHMLEAQQHLHKVQQVLLGELGRPPTVLELSKASKVSVAKLNQMHKFIMGRPMSLDRPVHEDDDYSLGDTMADPDTEEHSPEQSMTTSALTDQIKEHMHHLSAIEADVLTKRFGLGDDEERTFREIGDQYGLSRERIRQIQNSALEKLKKALEKEHGGELDI